MPFDDLIDMLRRAIELGRPDLRHYYRMTRKARVVASYASDGKYYADVQPLRNDETEDEAEPVVPKVEIPVIWAGPKRGVVCPPVIGAYCDLSYYDGDPNYPRISNFRWHSMEAPEAALDEFVVQLEPGVEIRIDRQKHVVTLTPENVRTEAGKDIEAAAGKNWTIQAGDNASITAGQNATMQAGAVATIAAPQVVVAGNLSLTGANGAPGTSTESGNKTHTGDYALSGGMNIGGDLSIGGSLNVGGTADIGGEVTAPHFNGPASRLG